MASGSPRGGMRFPARISTPSGVASFPGSSPRCPASFSFSRTRRGVATGVGEAAQRIDPAGAHSCCRMQRDRLLPYLPSWTFQRLAFEIGQDRSHRSLLVVERIMAWQPASLAERLVVGSEKTNPFDIRGHAGGQPIGLCLLQGLACSSWAASCSRSCSSPKRPTNCTPIGKLSDVQCNGTLMAG